MRTKGLEEVTKEKEKAKSKETYGLEFVPSQETLDAIEEAKYLSRTSNGAYDNFDEFWKDLMLDED